MVKEKHAKETPIDVSLIKKCIRFTHSLINPYQRTNNSIGSSRNYAISTCNVYTFLYNLLSIKRNRDSLSATTVLVNPFRDKLHCKTAAVTSWSIHSLLRRLIFPKNLSACGHTEKKFPFLLTKQHSRHRLLVEH